MRSIAVLAGLSVVLLAGCGSVVGSGDPATSERDVEAFDAVRLEGVGDVRVEIGSPASVVVETDDNLLERITTEVEAGVLVIDEEDPGTILPRSGLRIEVVVPALTSVDMAGAGSIDVGTVTSERFAVAMGGAGSVTIADLTADELAVNLSGAGDITIAGSATTQTVSLSGAGDYDGGDLRTEAADITASGVGGVEVWVVESLSVTASGVGSVSYWGSPSTNISASGVGSIDSLGDK